MDEEEDKECVRAYQMSTQQNQRNNQCIQQATHPPTHPLVLVLASFVLFLSFSRLSPSLVVVFCLVVGWLLDRRERYH